MAEIMRRQMRSVGMLHALAPVMDVARDARWGRIQEGAGEDPYLGAAMARATVADWLAVARGEPPELTRALLPLLIPRAGEEGGWGHDASRRAPGRRRGPDARSCWRASGASRPQPGERPRSPRT